MSGRGRGMRPGGVVRALMRFFLLVVLGFAAGLVIGVVSEEPELLAGHLRGQSTDVALSQNAARIASDGDAGDGIDSEFGLPEVAAAPEPIAAERPSSAGAPAASPAPAPTARPAPAPTPTPPPAPRVAIAPAAPVAAPAPAPERARISSGGDAFAIQVGAFSDEGSAASLARGLGQKGYPAEVLPSAGSARRWRVRVQPLANEGAANAMAGRLKREEGLPTWVLKMEPGTGQGRSAR